MSSNTTNLLLEDLVVESRLEFALSRCRSGDIHSSLSTTQDNVVLLGGDACAVEGRIGGVGLQDLKISSCDQLGRLVLASGDQVRAVCVPLEIGDGGVELVNEEVVQLLAGLGIIL